MLWTALAKRTVRGHEANLGSCIFNAVKLGRCVRPPRSPPARARSGRAPRLLSGGLTARHKSVQPLGNARLARTCGDHRLHGSHCVVSVAIACEQVPTPARLEVCSEFLHIPPGPSLGVDKTNLGRIAVDMEILDSDVNKLADPRTRSGTAF
jgi:hypothetical protein